MTFRDMHTIREMFAELSGRGRLEEEVFRYAQWRSGWYWRASEADRELIKQQTRSYARRPDVRASRNDRQRHLKRLERKLGTERARTLWRARRRAGKALNALAAGGHRAGL